MHKLNNLDWRIVSHIFLFFQYLNRELNWRETVKSKPEDHGLDSKYCSAVISLIELFSVCHSLSLCAPLFIYAFECLAFVYLKIDKTRISLKIYCGGFIKRLVRFYVKLKFYSCIRNFIPDWYLICGNCPIGNLYRIV